MRLHRGRAALAGVAACGVAGALVCGACVPGAARASAPPAKAPVATGFTVTAVGQDGFYRYAARPGTAVAGRVRVRNLRGRAITVVLSPADAITASTGGVSFPAARVRGAAGSWFTLSRTKVHLAAGASALVGFRATIPAGAGPGEHYAGIVAVDQAEAATAAAPSHRRGVSIHHLTRLALPVKVTVPGALVHHVSLKGMTFGVDAAGSKLRLALANDGTIITRGTTIRLAVSSGGRRLFSVDQALGDFLPGTSIAFPVAWRGQLARGTYDVSGVIQPRHAPAIQVSQHVTFTPQLSRQLKDRSGQTAASIPSSGPSLLIWLALGAALAVAGFAATAYLRLRRRLDAQSSAHPA